LNLFDLTEEIAVVIGGTGVLGGAMASGLASAGARVVVMGRRGVQGQERVDLIRNAGGTAVYVACDATSKESLSEAHEAARSHFGEVTVLVNAAGGVQQSSVVIGERRFEDITLDAWNENFNVNLTAGTLLPCQEFGPRMVRNGKGSVINIASVSSHLPLSRVVAYSAAKAAVLNLTKWLAREWATTGVRVNSISPGFFPAEQNRRMLYNEDGTPTPRTMQIMAHTPMARFGDPDELVGATVFLASPRASSFVTGADIAVDGGYTATTI
jgi:NAD(P)-dependent dehydrogenase (short-subunit alcohol dehydrogenase family)